MTATQACGTWPSPLSAAQATAGSLRLMQPRAQAGWVYWIESRPLEQGRCVLMRARPDTSPEMLLPARYSVRSHVHEYGGGAFAVQDDKVAFVNDADQQIYLLTGTEIHRLTDIPGARFGDLLMDPVHDRLVCVREQRTQIGGEPENSLVAIPLHGGRLVTLASGHDFYSSPALNPAATRLAWLQWDHPGLPWDGCELWCATLDAEGRLLSSKQRAGGADESLFQPRFAPDGRLHVVSDRSGWWNLYRESGDGWQALTESQAEYGFAQWNLGMSRYGFRRDGSILAARTLAGRSQLVEIRDNSERVVPLPLTQIEHLDVMNDTVALLGSSPQTANTVYAGLAPPKVLRESSQCVLEAGDISVANAIDVTVPDGVTVHAWYYPPRHPQYRALEGERPPLIVKCHGGPTAMSGDGLDPRIQFWTSRGFAVADVNYRGSSGFGRHYRRGLRGVWGIKDVEDCATVVRWLAAQGLADASRCAISGNSAGGYTVLSALVSETCFQAGAVYYGISELVSAMTDTHKFESRYADSLLGPWPEAAAIYRARSPLYAVERIRRPVIFFQGQDDRVVPPDQTERMVAALRARDHDVTYLSFPGEGHGFRRADTLTRALEAELAFYGRVFGFVPA